MRLTRAAPALTMSSWTPPISWCVAPGSGERRGLTDICQLDCPTAARSSRGRHLSGHSSVQGGELLDGFAPDAIIGNSAATDSLAGSGRAAHAPFIGIL